MRTTCTGYWCGQEIEGDGPQVAPSALGALGRWGAGRWAKGRDPLPPAAGKRSSFVHRRASAEKIYVILSGTGRLKLEHGCEAERGGGGESPRGTLMVTLPGVRRGEHSRETGRRLSRAPAAAGHQPRCCSSVCRPLVAALRRNGGAHGSRRIYPCPADRSLASARPYWATASSRASAQRRRLSSMSASLTDRASTPACPAAMTSRSMYCW
jgi:hypothetical protein